MDWTPTIETAWEIWQQVVQEQPPVPMLDATFMAFQAGFRAAIAICEEAVIGG